MLCCMRIIDLKQAMLIQASKPLLKLFPCLEYPILPSLPFPVFTITNLNILQGLAAQFTFAFLGSLTSLIWPFSTFYN